MEKAILIGNAFPLTLIRNHQVKISEVSLDFFRDELRGGRIFSFWGHENSRLDAETYLGIKLKTMVERPVLELSDEEYPMLDNHVFKHCYVLSPDYSRSHRPAIGAEVSAALIKGWHLLRLSWQD